MREPTIVVGAITKAHGLRGEVAVQVLSDNPERFADGATVWLKDGRQLTVRGSRGAGARLLISFEEVGDRAAAESLRGAILVVPESMLPDLPEDQYWPHQLEGCEVTTESGRALGAIRDVIANPANDIWVTVEGDREILVPAIHEVVVSVDIAGKRVVVRDVPGLTAPDEN